jgi:hypothetical protein
VTCINLLRSNKQSIQLPIRVMFLRIKDIRAQLKTFTRMRAQPHPSINMNHQSKLNLQWTQPMEEETMEETSMRHKAMPVHLHIKTTWLEITITLSLQMDLRQKSTGSSVAVLVNTMMLYFKSSKTSNGKEKWK